MTVLIVPLLYPDLIPFHSHLFQVSNRRPKVLPCQRLQQRFKSLAFEPPQPTIKPGPNLAIWPRRDLADLDCLPKLIERLVHGLFSSGLRAVRS
jgi:hypothetical protein